MASETVVAPTEAHSLTKTATTANNSSKTNEAVGVVTVSPTTLKPQSSTEQHSAENTPTNTATSVTEGDEELVHDEQAQLPPPATKDGTSTTTTTAAPTTTVFYPTSTAAAPSTGGAPMMVGMSYYGAVTGTTNTSTSGGVVVMDPAAAPSSPTFATTTTAAASATSPGQNPFQTNTTAANDTGEPSPLSPPRGTATVPTTPGSSSGGATNHPGNPIHNNNNNNNSTSTNNSNPALFPRLGGNTTVVSSSSPVVVYPSPYALTATSTPNPEDEGVNTTWMTADQRNSQQPSPQVNSQGMPIVGYVGGTMSATTRSNRAYSFEETMLPPAATGVAGMGDATNGTGGRLPPQELVNPAYSPYGGASTSSPGAGSATLFAHPWPYSAGPPPDLYGTTPPSPLQPRPSPHIPPLPHHPGTAAAVAMGYAPPHPHATLGMRPMPPQQATTTQQGQGQQQQSQAPPPPPPLPGTAGGPYGNAGGANTGAGGLPPHHHHHPHNLHHHPQAGVGPFGGFPTSSPGPPIQTTASNKGPDGANLFIFHIPNHFTNLDMYQLFEPYGNLLSVRIMVERDTGRSRGFGFVSYDSPESAALAIKSLNGFAIGNKRLKVQHKQIRPRDMQQQQQQQGPNGYGPAVGGGGYAQQQQQPPLQYSNYSAGGPAASTAWYHTDRAALDPTGTGTKQPSQVGSDEHTELTSSATSTTTGDVETTPLHMGSSGGGGSHDPSAMSPLASLGSLQSALPDTTTTTTTTSASPSGAPTTTTKPATATPTSPPAPTASDTDVDTAAPTATHVTSE